jgi:hypothetical protein
VRRQLLRARLTTGSLRFLFLDEANRLSRDNLGVLFDLCETLDLQRLIAAPEVARAEGKTTYQRVRHVTDDGREEVIVSGGAPPAPRHRRTGRADAIETRRTGRAIRRSAQPWVELTLMPDAIWRTNCSAGPTRDALRGNADRAWQWRRTRVCAVTKSGARERTTDAVRSIRLGCASDSRLGFLSALPFSR